MHRFRICSLSFGLMVGCLSAACFGAALSGENAGDNCQIGTYRFSDGEIVDIAQSEGKTFRWRKFDGTTGVLHKKQDGSWTSTLGCTDHPDGHGVSFTPRRTSEIELDGKKARRIPCETTALAYECRS